MLPLLVALMLATSVTGQNYDYDYGGDGAYGGGGNGGGGNYYGEGGGAGAGGNYYGGGGGGGNYYGGGGGRGNYYRGGGGRGNYYRGGGGGYGGGGYGGGGNYNYGNGGYGGGGNYYYGNYNYGNGSYYGNYGNGSYYGNYNYGNGSYYGNYNYGNGSYYGNYYDGNYGYGDYNEGRAAEPEMFTDCGGELTELPWAIIKTPGYPTEENPQGVYPNNAYCKWWYNGDEKTLVRFKVWELVVEIGEGGSNITCDFDYMNVTITSSGSKRYCGYVTPEEEFTGMGSLTVIFVSDGDVGYRGIQATYQIQENHDPCNPSPCSVNGDCEVMPDYLRIRCNCHAGYRGQRCEFDIRECESNPCKNGATCDDTKAPDLYVCHCRKGFEGINCETRIPDPCWNEPCQNGGTCNKATDTTFTCSCAENYKGSYCEIANFPPCHLSPCKNEGTCHDVVKGEEDESGDEGSSKDDGGAPSEPKEYDGYYCICTAKYRGDHCEIETGCLNPGIPYLEDGHKFEADATIEFSCADGYVLVGVANVTCSADGTWSHPMPECEMGEELAAMKQAVTPWSGTMMALGGALVINIVAFASWMIVKEPWKKIERVITISQANLRTREEIDREASTCDDSSSYSGSSYSGSSSSSSDIP